MAAGFQKKYYVLNKKSDFLKGYMEGFTICGRGGREQLRLNTDGGYGLFISPVFDSLETQTVWHRMVFKGDTGSDASWRLSFFAAEEPWIYEDDQSTDIAEVIGRRPSACTAAEKKALFAPYLKYTVTGATDVLLHGVCGRYVWFMAECCESSQPVLLGDVMLYFPRQTWVRYLPEVYDQSPEDTFLDRYLGIFQTLYDDLGDVIDRIPDMLDAGSADSGGLRLLGSWLGIEHMELWTDDQLRFLVSHAAQFYGLRGTKAGISAFVELYTGEAPMIVEQHLLEHFSQNRGQYELLTALYGDSPYEFCVLIREECLPDARALADVQMIIERVKPAWMDFKILTLRPYILLDSYSYLGINSVMGQYRPAQLGEGAMVAFATVGETPLK